MSDIVQIRKKTGLGQIQTKAGSKQTITPKLYNQEKKDPNSDGEYVEDWDTAILNTKRGLCPHWSDIDNKWCFSGTDADFVRLVDAMSLKYQPGHEKAGQLIRVKPENFQRHLRDFHDVVFQNPALYGKHYMEGGSVGLTKVIPDHEFLLLCLKGDRGVIDRSSDKRLSSYTSSASQLEMISPERIIAATNKDIKESVRATVLFAGLDGFDEKIKIVCSVLDVSGYNDKTAANAAYNLLHDRIVTNTNHSAKYGTTPQKRFVEVMEKSDEELNVMAQIMKGTKKGFLRKFAKGYKFQERMLEGVVNQVLLIEHFRDPANQKDYTQLLELLEL